MKLIYLFVYVLVLLIMYFAYSNKTNSLDLVWKKLIVIGDSNVESGSGPSNTWLSLLSRKILRMCDIVNRGFGGYNTENIRLILPKLMSEFQSKLESIAGVIILLGTNDSCESESKNVQIDRYAENYQWIIDHLLSIGLKLENIIIITPPRIADEKNRLYLNLPKSELKYHDHLVKDYARRCKEIAIKNRISYVDLYDLMDKSGKAPEKYLSDGLHLNQLGSELLVENLWPIIKDKFIETNILKFNFPHYTNITKENLKDLPQYPN